MQPISKHSSAGRTGASVALALAVTLLSSACSKSEGGGQRPSAHQPSVETVVRTDFGKADGQLGKSSPDQGLPEGPRSFVVDSKSNIYVLDRLNTRIQSFSSGKPAGSVTIADRPFDDIELDGHGGFVLLDAHAEPALVFVDQSGNTTGEVSLLNDQIAEPSLVTGIVRAGDGFYVEVEDDFLVRIADTDGKAVEATVVPGQALDGTTAFKVDADDSKHLALYRIPLPDGDPSELGSVAFTEEVAERTLFAPGLTGGLLLATRLAGAQSDPEAPVAEKHTLVVIDPSGVERERVDLPPGDGVLDLFRPVRRGEDGAVYVMSTSPNGLEIAKVVP